MRIHNQCNFVVTATIIMIIVFSRAAVPRHGAFKDEVSLGL